ncbi:MAG: acetolactate synthase large subunit [Syntrophaceae bacterium]|nr:acetolactate synthase large subunit [Syntrophaceae bacterium]
MNGAQALLDIAAAAGIEVCFANAGTTEMPIVAAFDSNPRIKPILGLFEGVCTGAADGYARMAGKPALTLLHLGPGMANGIANLHNARRARSPLFMVIGEHASWHIQADPLLNMDIAGLCRTFSEWQRTSLSTTAIPIDTAAGITACRYGLVASLIVPSNYLGGEYHGDQVSLPPFSYDAVDSDKIETAAKILHAGGKTALIMNGKALLDRGLKAAARIRAKTGCDLFSVTFPTRIERGSGIVPVTRIPYFPEPALALLAPYESAIFAGTDEPATFFGYEGLSSYFMQPNVKRLRLDSNRQDAGQALEALANALGAPSGSALEKVLSPYHLPELPTGKLTPEKACLTLSALQPEHAIVIDEGLTSTTTYSSLSASAAPHNLLYLTGGAIGQGMPCATGAAIACPERPVINIQADGSAMYTLQSLWTQAREGLNVTTLICANHSYNIIRVELERAGYTKPGAPSLSLIDLGNPPLDWVSLAKGMGVSGFSVETAEDLARALRIALSEPGPRLIEMVL